MNLKGRNFLKLMDFTPEEILYLIDLSAELKKEKKQGIVHDSLVGKNIALIFEKTSTRTRCSFEVAAHDLGMSPTLTQAAHRLARRRVLQTPQGCWEECLMVSSTADTARRL